MHAFNLAWSNSLSPFTFSYPPPFLFLTYSLLLISPLSLFLHPSIDQSTDRKKKGEMQFFFLYILFPPFLAATGNDTFLSFSQSTCLIFLVFRPCFRCVVRSSPLTAAFYTNLVQSPTNLFVVELFSMRTEKLGNIVSAVPRRGVKESRNFSSLDRTVPCRIDRFPMFILSITFLYSSSFDYVEVFTQFPYSLDDFCLDDALLALF